MSTEASWVTPRGDYAANQALLTAAKFGQKLSGWDCVRNCGKDSGQPKEFDVLGFTKASVAVKGLNVVVLRD